jgi:hypothetical protein
MGWSKPGLVGGLGPAERQSPNDVTAALSPTWPFSALLHACLLPFPLSFPSPSPSAVSRRSFSPVSSNADTTGAPTVPSYTTHPSTLDALRRANAHPSAPSSPPMAASSAFLLALLAPSALAAPSAALPAAAAPLLLRAAHLLHARESVITEYADGNTTVTDSGTGLIISQAPATDGGGHGFDVPAVVWLACAFAAGAPLLLAGLKLGRLTTALSLGCLVTALGTFEFSFRRLSRRSSQSPSLFAQTHF